MSREQTSVGVDGKTSAVTYDKLGRVEMHTISSTGGNVCAEKYVYDHTAAENRTCGMPTRMEFYKRGTSGAFTYNNAIPCITV